MEDIGELLRGLPSERNDNTPMTPGHPMMDENLLTDEKSQLSEKNDNTPMTPGHPMMDENLLTDEKGLLSEKNDNTPMTPGQPMTDENLTDEKKDDDPDISPPDASPNARKIPEGSTVRRRLFADDGPAEPSRNPNRINSGNDVDRMIREDMERGAGRWGFDVQSEEPNPNGALLWDGTPRRRVEIRKRRPVANRREMESEERDDPDMAFIAWLGNLDNIANKLMDGTYDYCAESVQHWNFDFDTKMPAAGPVVWKQVGSHWVGNKPQSFTRLVLYPTETVNGVNTSISHEESHEEFIKGKADKSVLKPTDNIEHLLTAHVYAIYGDWKREMQIGKKTASIITARPEIDRDVLRDMRLLQNTHQHHLITKSQAIGLIRIGNASINEADYNSNDVNSATGVC